MRNDRRLAHEMPANLDLRREFMKLRTALRVVNRLFMNPNTREGGCKGSVIGFSAEVPLPCLFLACSVVFAALLSGSPAAGATNYVRSGAAGANSGKDWANAYKDLPASLVRGDTYYVADGTYGSHKFNDERSGTSVILIKKATVADHGTATGWQDEYGDGQADFSPLTFGTPAVTGNGGYYEFNGYSPSAPKQCGFRIVTHGIPDGYPENQTSIHYGYGGTGNHPYCSWRYIEFKGPGGSGTYNSVTGTPSLIGIYAHGNNGSCDGCDTSHMVVSHCYFHGITTPLFDLNGNNYMTVEYSEFCDNRDEGGTDHSNIYWVGSSYGIFRYNRVHNYNVEGLFFGGSTTGWQIYGNVFYDGVSVARGIEFREPQSQRDMKIYNNTFVNLPLPAIRVMEASVCSGVDIRNNLMVNTGGIALQNGGSGVTSVNNVDSTTSAFVNHSADNYQLAGPTAAGTPLPSPYNVDVDGKIRGADGVWDVGAYEYSLGASTNPVIQVSPAVLSFGSLAAGASATNSFVVQNAGAGMLSGTAAVATACTNYLRIVSGGTYSLGANQSQVVTVRYSPSGNGTDNGIITCGGGGGAQVTVTGSLLAVLPGLSFPSYAGDVTAPFTTNGGFVSQTVDASDVTDGGAAVYGFHIPTAGNYVISANVNAPSTAANSFYVNIDAQPTDPTMIWDAAVGAGFIDQVVSWRGNGTDVSNQFVPAVFSLTAGTHQLIIRGREAGMQLGQITIRPFAGVRPGSPQNLRIVATTP